MSRIKIIEKETPFTEVELTRHEGQGLELISVNYKIKYSGRALDPFECSGTWIYHYRIPTPAHQVSPGVVEETNSAPGWP